MTAPEVRRKMHTVLIADSKLYVTSLLSTRLRKKGYRTLVAHSGEEALELLINAGLHNVHLALIGNNLGDILGPQLARLLKATLPDFPIVRVSRRQLNLPKNDAWLPEPFILTRVFQTVEFMLGRQKRGLRCK
jgi:CheY-like chemotaxis protein